jgi:hypothetical protein
MSLLRRITGAIGTAGTWGSAWFAAGFTISGLLTLTGFGPLGAEIGFVLLLAKNIGISRVLHRRRVLCPPEKHLRAVAALRHPHPGDQPKGGTPCRSRVHAARPLPGAIDRGSTIHGVGLALARRGRRERRHTWPQP